MKITRQHLPKVLKMFKSKSAYSVTAIAAVLALSSCNVHEWPQDEEESYPFVLDMQFETNLPLYKEVCYTRDAKAEESRAGESDHDIRYIVNVYSVTDEDDANRFVWRQYKFNRSYAINHDYRVQLQLPEGNYRFRVWSDHVNTESQEDKYYNTTDFTELYLHEEDGHQGSNEFRDAFRGEAYGVVEDPELYYQRHGVAPDNHAQAQMKRPMGRYEFISTDLDEFLDKAVQNANEETREALLRAASRAQSRGEDTKGEIFWNGLTRDEVAEAIGLGNYRVVFGYNAFMPSSYNLYTDKPSDSSTGVTYESKMQVSNEGMQMGFDYILVDDQTTMNLNMSVYDSEGNLIANTSGVEVPVARSKNTVVKGTFLTVSNGGGVAIDPGFDGDDFNIKVGY